MQYTGLNELREKFLSFFESKGHLRLDSFPLIPKDDNSLLLINSGMAPMKKWFLGQATPPRKRVTTCQKCIRTPDIERVGKTSRHGTYFEMLGNFSFGDYFKHEVTGWAWDFITNVLEIPKDKLWVTVYETDDEARNIWINEVGVSPDRIVKLGKEDNFWEIGSGPCGPCSEIYFDRGPEKGCGSPTCGVGCDCDRYVEFWNLVFSQYDSDGNGTYTPMEHPNIDTGMGLERLACIMQGVDNLFEVDTVQNIMKHISKIAGVTYGNDKQTDVSLRVITDHVRSTTFMIADGVVPTNEGRGYVLRRLLRRAARHGKLIGINEPFLYEVCDTVIKENESAYPELVMKKEYIKKTIRAEEERFKKTIDSGMELLGELSDKLLQEGKTRLDGADAFKLYDTFGFPVDITREILAEKGMTLDEEEFERCMEVQRNLARSARERQGDISWDTNEVELDFAPTKFCGYTHNTADSKVLTLIADGERCESASQGDSVVMVLDETPFYAESGGQVCDTGTVTTDNGTVRITNVKKDVGGHFLHYGVIEKGSVTEGDTAKPEIDAARREAIRRNHTAAHLLQAALRTVLGNHVHQAGQYVCADSVRFDFSHFAAMTEEEKAKVEAIVNEEILAGHEVVTHEMPIEEAKKTGAMALFSEKYSDIVRVVDIDKCSIEFCGGTHATNTARLGLFKIFSEASVSAGVRRIEAITGLGVLNLLSDCENLIYNTATAIKCSNITELTEKATELMNTNKQLEHTVAALNARIADEKAAKLGSNIKCICGYNVLCADLGDTEVDVARDLCAKYRDKTEKSIVIIAVTNKEKTNICVCCSKEAISGGIPAGVLAKKIAVLTGGNGGGRPDSAVAGIGDKARLAAALNSLDNIIAEIKK